MFTLDLAALPRVTMNGKVKEGVGWSHNGRSMKTNMLVIFQDGACEFKVDGRVLEFRRGDAALVPQGVYYKPHTDSFVEYTFFHFDGQLQLCRPEEVTGLSQGADSGRPVYGRMDAADTRLLFDYKMSVANLLPEIEVLLNRCVNTRRAGKGNRELLLSIQFSELLFQVSQAFRDQVNEESALPASLSKMLLYIQENYTHTITLDDLERHTGFSKQYCMRLFKSHMNMTINEYILDLRMRHAAYLLRDTYMNVNQAADYLGFSSVSYFSRVFKRYYGVSPSEYFS